MSTAPAAPAAPARVAARAPAAPLLLALDTSTFTQSLALLRGPSLLAECTLEARGGHSPDQLAMIRWLLDRVGASLHDLTALAIGLGPGSFTGLRVGLALLKGLAFAYQKPLIGVPSLAATALQVALTSPTPALVCPCTDARKAEVYAALYRAHPSPPQATQGPQASADPQPLQAALLLPPLLPPLVGAPADLIAHLRACPALDPALSPALPLIFAGNGALLYSDALRAAFPDAHVIASAACAHPRAFTLGLLALPHLHSPPPLATLEPLYIRPSDAEIALRAGKLPSLREL